MDQTKPEKLSQVRKHNRLVDARARLHLHTLRVWVLAISKLDFAQPDSRMVSFSAREYAELLGSPCHHLHAQLRRAARELMDTVVSIPSDDFRQNIGTRRGWTDAALAAAAKLDARTGVFQMEFPEMLVEQIFGVYENYCLYDLGEAMKFTSRHAFRFLN